MKRQPILRCQLGYEFLVSVRSAPAQLVIEMGHTRDNSQFLAQFQQQQQQCHGVPATGYRYAYAVAGAQHAVLVNCFVQPAGKILPHWAYGISVRPEKRSNLRMEDNKRSGRTPAWWCCTC